MRDNIDCVTTKCKHTFHKECVTKWLANSQECRNCEKLCHIKDLVSANSKSIVNPIVSLRGRGRGSATKRYGTRGSKIQDEGVSSSQNTHGQVDDNVRPQGDFQVLESIINNRDNTQNLSQMMHNSTHNTTQNSNRSRRNNNFNRMSHMIETSGQ